MKIKVKNDLSNISQTDTVVVFLDEENIKQLDATGEVRGNVLVEKSDISFFFGAAGEVTAVSRKDGANLILCGLGEHTKINREKIRNSAAAVTGFCRSGKISSVSIVVPQLGNLKDEDVLLSVAEGLMLSDYSFDKYKSDRSRDIHLDKVVFYTELSGASAILKEALIVAENTYFCRDLVNDTTNEINPVDFAKLAKKISSASGMKCTVLDEKAIKKKNMGLLLAVNKGSDVPPRFVIVEYKGNPSSKKTIGFVGKGITFDSGGMNLKPGGSMGTMRMDMAGAGTVLSIVKTASELKIKKNITAVMPLTENMLSSSAFRPGDVYTSYNGKTVEIGNTDAEGRLILADALAYMEKELKPDVIVDMATLTGACVAAFGETVAAFLSEDDSVASVLESSAEITGEKLWRLPFYEDYDDRMKSDAADLNNMSSEKNAGTIAAAVFLRNFVEKTPWAHVDIAGTAWYSKARGYRPKNATGYGLRLMIDFIKEWK